MEAENPLPPKNAPTDNGDGVLKHNDDHDDREQTDQSTKQEIPDVVEEVEAPLPTGAPEDQSTNQKEPAVVVMEVEVPSSSLTLGAPGDQSTNQEGLTIVMEIEAPLTPNAPGDQSANQEGPAVVMEVEAPSTPVPPGNSSIKQEDPAPGVRTMEASLTPGAPDGENANKNITPNSLEKAHYTQIADRPGEVVIFLEESTSQSEGGLEVAVSSDPDGSVHKSGKNKFFEERLLEEMFGKRKRIVWDEARPLECPVCQKEFKNLGGLRRHVRRHYEEKSHSCPECGKMFYRLGDCKRHQQSCEQRPFRCEFCIFCFSTKEEWEEHMGRHINEPGHKCDLCNAMYLHQRSLKQHMKLKHSDHLRKAEEEKAATSMECSHCQEVFGDVEKFREHMDNNHRDMESKVPFAKYRCSFCPQVFSTLRGQRVHLRATHENEFGDEAYKKTPYQCELCGKVMSMKNAEYHQRTHTGERPFKCDTCGKNFASKPNLKEHQRVHSKEKPYKCRYCPMSFTASGTRVRHERKHTGEMPYACTFCGKRFRALSGYEVHERTHTGVTPYQCRYCPKKFTYRNRISVHEKACHPDVYKKVRYGVEVSDA